MRARTKPFLEWLFALVLLAGFLWSLNQTIFNVWVAGGPPTPHPEIYAHRANIFGLVTLAFLLALIAAVVWAVVRKRRA